MKTLVTTFVLLRDLTRQTLLYVLLSRTLHIKIDCLRVIRKDRLLKRSLFSKCLLITTIQNYVLHPSSWKESGLSFDSVKIVCTFSDKYFGNMDS